MRHLALLVVSSLALSLSVPARAADAAEPPPPSYAALPPLSFEQLPYTSLEGRPWPLRRASLPRTAKAHGLGALRVAYVELNPRGKKGTLVFVHGLGSYLKFWRYQLDAFAAQGYRVLALDLPGYGKSDKPAGFPYSSEALADALHEWTQRVGAKRPVLVGHSLGGQTALAYALRHPEALGALALTAPAGFEAFSDKEKALISGALTVAGVKGADEAAVRRNVAAANFRTWRPELEWLIEERVRLAKTPAFDAYASAQVASVVGLTRNEPVREHLDGVRAPTAVLFGAEDRLIPNPYLHPGPTGALMAWGAKQIAGARAVELPGCGHAVQLDCPQGYNAALQEFLQGLEH